MLISRLIESKFTIFNMKSNPTRCETRSAIKAELPFSQSLDDLNYILIINTQLNGTGVRKSVDRDDTLDRGTSSISCQSCTIRADEIANSTNGPKNGASLRRAARTPRGLSRVYLEDYSSGIVRRQRAIQLGTFYDRSTRCLSLRHNLFERNRGTSEAAAVPPAGFDGSRLRAHAAPRVSRGRKSRRGRGRGRKNS